MPISPALISSSIRMHGLPVGLMGTEFPRMAEALGTGFYESFVTPGVFSATLTGVSGIGVVSSLPPVGVLPMPLAQSISSCMAACGMAGVAVPQVATAIANGLAQSLLALQLFGACPTVSSGGGVAKPVGLNFLLVQSALLKAATFYGLSGQDMPRFMLGIAQGVSAFLVASMTVPVIAVGPPVPPPPVGPFPSMGLVPLTAV